MIKNFEDMKSLAGRRGPLSLSVAVPEDHEVLAAIKAALGMGIVHPLLVGDKSKIESIASEVGLDLTLCEVIDARDPKEACHKAVALISQGRADLVMKGLVDTSVILKAVLNKEAGLRTGRILSHTAVMRIPSYHKFLLIADAAMNIAPTLEEKKQITENAVFVAHALEIPNPKVAVLCAKEKVDLKMPATLDAEALRIMNEQGEISGCLVGGPFALDNAVSSPAARHKGITHPVAGDADILIVPAIETGNVLYKALNFLLPGTSSAGIIIGAKIPIVLNSRADSDEAKLNSIVLGTLLAAQKTRVADE